MLNKGKLSREILGLLGAAFAVALFFWFFAGKVADSIVVSYCAQNALLLEEETEWAIQSWIHNISSVAAVTIFVVLFLFLVGEKIERTARELQAEEALLREERETLIRNLSHDIRTPLTAILSYSEYMRAKHTVEKEELEIYFELMQQKAGQIKALTDRLLDNNHKQLEEIPNGRLLMEQLVAEWEMTLEERFQCKSDWSTCPAFSGQYDVQELRRIFDNLASNIEKYGKENELVQLRIFKEDKRLVIEQRNQKKATITQVESRKIGLESIRKIAENYGGSITIKQNDQEYMIRIILFELP